VLVIERKILVSDVCARLIEWQAKLQLMEARLDELERLLDRYRALTLAIEPSVPPPPASRIN